MTTLKVHIRNAQKALPLPDGTRALIRAAVAAALKEENFARPAEVSVTLVDDGRIRELNRDFRQIDRATDVLSFPLGEGGVYDEDPATGFAQLGDVVLSLEHAVAQAEEYGHSVAREIGYLTVHSVLHLLGYDHVGDPAEAADMRAREEAVMAALNLTREDRA